MDETGPWSRAGESGGCGAGRDRTPGTPPRRLPGRADLLENIRSAIFATEGGRRTASLDDMRDLAGLAREEVIDALEVSAQGLLADRPDFGIAILRVRLIAARQSLEAVREARDGAAAQRSLANAANLLRLSRGLLAEEATLPESFRN